MQMHLHWLSLAVLGLLWFVYLPLEIWTAQRRIWIEAWRLIGLMVLTLYSPNRNDGECLVGLEG